MEGQMTFEFAKRPTIKGYPELRWTGKRPYESTQYYPAQLRERYGEETNGWINKIFWGDNLQVMSHLLKEYRGKVQLIYIDPPFDSRVDYKMKVELKGKKPQMIFQHLKRNNMAIFGQMMNIFSLCMKEKEYVEDWRQLVESIMIDWNYDGVVMQPSVTDVPDKKEIVSGIYDIPEDAGTIRVKITDLLSESLEMEVE